MMYKRDFLKRTAVKNKDEMTWMQYKNLGNSINKELKVNQKKYYKEKLDECQKDPNKVWKLIDEITGRKNYQ